MVREDQLEYEITSGKYRPYDGGVDETPFTQATATYGVSSSLTLYGGMQAASRYQALSTGLGYNLGELGAASADVTQAPGQKKKEDEKTSGQSPASSLREKHCRNRHQRHHRRLSLLYSRV